MDELHSTPPSHAVHSAIEIAWTRCRYGGGRWRSDDGGSNHGRDRDRTGHTASWHADSFAVDDGAGGGGGEGYAQGDEGHENGSLHAVLRCCGLIDAAVTCNGAGLLSLDAVILENAILIIDTYDISTHNAERQTPVV